MKKWRLLDTGVNDPYYNMAVDEAIMKAHSQELVPPTFRFYQWSPPGLSLGLSQKINKTVDLDKCKQHGVQPVRRLTGGRSVLHQEDELTYSLVLKESGFLSKSILESYKAISSGMITGLKTLGLDVDLQPVADKSEEKTAACFDSPARYEIVARGKKLIGSAQTRRKGVILQHGSIPFSINIDVLYDILKVPAGSRVKERLKKRFLKNATAINKEIDNQGNFNNEQAKAEHVSPKNQKNKIKTKEIEQNVQNNKEIEQDVQNYKEITISDLKRVLIKGLKQEFDIKIKKKELSSGEKEEARDLYENKYATEDWNHKL